MVSRIRETLSELTSDPKVAQKSYDRAVRIYLEEAIQDTNVEEHLAEATLASSKAFNYTMSELFGSDVSSESEDDTETVATEDSEKLMETLRRHEQPHGDPAVAQLQRDIKNISMLPDDEQAARGGEPALRYRLVTNLEKGTREFIPEVPHYEKKKRALFRRKRRKKQPKDSE